MKEIKEHYPHIHRHLGLLNKEPAVHTVNYIRSITIYELTEDRKDSRMGFNYEAFKELLHKLEEVIGDNYEIETTKHPER
jgi:hypothetical protein